MQLSMTVLRCPDKVTPETRSVPGGEFHVGRGPDVDWVLPDPDRLLSKRHFAVAFRGGGWQVADTSTNGTWLNGEDEQIGRGATRALRDGDRLRLGLYEIEIRLVDQPVQGASGAGFGGGFGGGMGASGGGAAAASPFGDPFADDPLAPPAPARRPFDAPAWPDHGLTPGGARLPHDFDPLTPDHDQQFGISNSGTTNSAMSRLAAASAAQRKRITRPRWKMRWSLRRSPASRRPGAAGSFPPTTCCRTIGTRICWRASRHHPRPAVSLARQQRSRRRQTNCSTSPIRWRHPHPKRCHRGLGPPPRPTRRGARRRRCQPSSRPPRSCRRHLARAEQRR